MKYFVDQVHLADGLRLPRVSFNTICCKTTGRTIFFDWNQWWYLSQTPTLNAKIIQKER